jgi:hypothetical protein
MTNKFKSRFDRIPDFREARKRKYPIKTIPGFPQGRLAIVPRRIIGFDKRDKTKGLADFRDAGVIINKRRHPEIFLIRLAKEIKNPKLKRELLTHELNHYKFKKFALKKKLGRDKDIKKIMKRNPALRRGENPFEETVVQLMTETKLDRKFEKLLLKKYPNLHKKVKRLI